MKTTVIKEIASRIIAIQNCQKSGNDEWEHNHKEFLRYMEKNLLPSGSGIDCGTKIDVERSQRNRIMLTTEYHHMNDGGYYDGWTSHDVVITADLHQDFCITIRGRNRNDIKDYLHDVFREALGAEIDTQEIFDKIQITT